MSTPGGDEVVDLGDLLAEVVVEPTAVTLTFGLIFLASNSAPFASATKNGLPIEPSEMPIDFRSLADAT